MDYNTRIEELLDDMSVFEDWTEKYEFIISQGAASARHAGEVPQEC